MHHKGESSNADAATESPRLVPLALRARLDSTTKRRRRDMTMRGSRPAIPIPGTLKTTGAARRQMQPTTQVAFAYFPVVKRDSQYIPPRTPTLPHLLRTHKWLS